MTLAQLGTAPFVGVHTCALHAEYSTLFDERSREPKRVGSDVAMSNALTGSSVEGLEQFTPTLQHFLVGLKTR